MLFLNNILRRPTSGFINDAHAFRVFGLGVSDAETIIDALKKCLVIDRLKRINKHIGSLIKECITLKNQHVLNDGLKECNRLAGSIPEIGRAHV